MERSGTLVGIQRVLRAAAVLLCFGVAGESRAVQLLTRTISFPLDTVSEFRPRLHGEFVVWQRGSGAGSEIRFWDTTQARALTANGVPDQNPETDGIHIVWEASNGLQNDVGVYDLLTGTTTILSMPGNEVLPQVSGTFLAWIQMVDADGEVFADDGLGFDWITGDSLVATEISIDGLHLVWSQGDDLQQTPGFADDLHDVAVWNEEENGFFILGTLATDDIHPVVANGVVVWQAGPDGSGDIWYGNVTGTSTPLYDGTDERNPHTDGSRVVWQHWDGNDFDIWRVDLATPGAIAPLTTDALDDSTPQIDGSNVVWVKEGAANDSEIWLSWQGAPPELLARTRNNGRDDVRPQLDGDHFVYESCVNLGQPSELCDIVLVPEPQATLAAAAALAILAGLASHSARRAVRIASQRSR